MTNPESHIRRFYATLYRAWGRQHWWPARTRLEVIVGAILTQNTAWTNVELALRRLRRARLLTLEGLRRTPKTDLAELIRSSGYFRQKARRLKNFIAFLDNHYCGSLDRMFRRPTAQLREELLALNGIGPETADSILLYAGNHSVFVVDAYTRRIVERHGLLPVTAKYEDIRALFERALMRSPVVSRQSPAAPPNQKRTALHLAHELSNVTRYTTDAYTSDASSRQGGTDVSPACKRWVSMQDGNVNPASAGDTAEGARQRNVLHGPKGSCHSPSPMSCSTREPLVQTYNEMHALIVGVGKNYCLNQTPRCELCPLRKFLAG